MKNIWFFVTAIWVYEILWLNDSNLVLARFLKNSQCTTKCRNFYQCSSYFTVLEGIETLNWCPPESILHHRETMFFGKKNDFDSITIKITSGVNQPVSPPSFLSRLVERKMDNEEGRWSLVPLAKIADCPPFGTLIYRFEDI